MATVVDRDGTVRLLREEFAAAAELCRGFGDDDWSTSTCLPGWTVKDQLSHMAGTEAMLAGDPVPAVEVGEAAHLRNDIARANEAWVEANRPLPGPQVLAMFEDVTARRLQALEAMTQADFDEASWTPAGPDESYGRFMRIRHFDCFMHEHDIRQALGLSDRPDARHVRSCLDEVATAIGYIAGRKARLPAGTTAIVELTGAVTAAYHVVVAGRASLVEALDGEPSITVRMPAMLWLCLTGGRQEGTPHIGVDVEIEGDENLGRQLVANLAFTI
ncbi:MAG: maleylpyruvate isomerase family mycothiol-dependent enzyme [Acidimicrobiales bacterium]